MGMNKCIIWIVLGGYLILVITSGSSFCEFFKKSKNIWFWFFPNQRIKETSVPVLENFWKPKNLWIQLFQLGHSRTRGCPQRAFLKTHHFMEFFSQIFKLFIYFIYYLLVKYGYIRTWYFLSVFGEHLNVI